MLRLHGYFRSSAAYRVRIALNLKRLPYEAVPVHLRRNGGEQHSPDFARLSPAHLIPVLEDGAFALTQSLAIMEYLDETHPSPPLLPEEPQARATVRAIALGMACDIHPLGNLRILHYLEKQLGVAEEGRRAWSRHWTELGLAAVEQLLVASGASQSFCYGDSPTVADCCLVPQVFNASRLACSLERYPAIRRIHEHCMRLPAFQQAAPDAQPDAE